jgi:hypothetical protein
MVRCGHGRSEAGVRISSVSNLGCGAKVQIRWLTRKWSRRAVEPRRRAAHLQRSADR